MTNSVKLTYDQYQRLLQLQDSIYVVDNFDTSVLESLDLVTGLDVLRNKVQKASYFEGYEIPRDDSNDSTHVFGMEEMAEDGTLLSAYSVMGSKKVERFSSIYGTFFWNDTEFHYVRDMFIPTPGTEEAEEYERVLLSSLESLCEVVA